MIRAGLLSLEYAKKARSGGSLTGAELSAWSDARYRIRSGNGLELALELKLLFDARTRWEGIPRNRRPPRPDYSLPADPSDIL